MADRPITQQEAVEAIFGLAADLLRVLTLTQEVGYSGSVVLRGSYIEYTCELGRVTPIYPKLSTSKVDEIKVDNILVARSWFQHDKEHGCWAIPNLDHQSQAIERFFSSHYKRHPHGD